MRPVKPALPVLPVLPVLPAPPAPVPPAPPERDPSPFHPGERAVQSRVGVRDDIAGIERRLFHDVAPDPHRALFARLPFVIVGSLDDAQRPWASIVVGRPGFITSPDPRTVRVGAWPGEADPLARNLTRGAPVALLGIELQARRRVRLNGTVAEVDAGGFAVRAAQSFGNCPKYIQARAPQLTGEPASMTAGAGPVEAAVPVLPARAAALIERADTFFIASASARPGGGDAADGVDVSHRGGKPGFVRVARGDGSTALSWPDFAGNFFFNTLGNLEVNPRAGLLFIDFASGDLLSLTGRTRVAWAGPEVDAFEGAQRVLHLVIDDGLLIERAVPLRWSATRDAPELAATGRW